MAKGKIKNHTPEQIAAKRATKLREAVNDVAETIGLPTVQRDDAILHIVPIGSAGASSKHTLRKLTCVEKLRNAGVLSADDAVACEWYAELYAMSWEMTGGVANYDFGGGGRSAHAPDRQMSRSIDQQRARDEYALARAVITEGEAEVFEAVICRNMRLSDFAAQRIEGGRTKREQIGRDILVRCAGRIRAVMVNRPAAYDPTVTRRAHLIETMVRMNAALSRSQKHEPAPIVAIEPPISIVALIDAEIARRPDATEIIMSPDVLLAMVRELGGMEDGASYGGLRVVVRDGWSWAWLLQRAEVAA